MPRGTIIICVTPHAVNGVPMSLEHSPTRTGNHAVQDGAEQRGPIDQVRVRILPDGRMTRREAARYLGRAEKTLAMWQMEGKLRGVRVGGRIFYFKDQLDALVRGEAA